MFEPGLGGAGRALGKGWAGVEVERLKAGGRGHRTLPKSSCWHPSPGSFWASWPMSNLSSAEGHRTVVLWAPVTQTWLATLSPDRMVSMGK